MFPYTFPSKTVSIEIFLRVVWVFLEEIITADGNKTILLVEDELILALAEKTMLVKLGYSVITAISGEKALESIKADPGISLVLMDIDLGEGMDGTESAVLILQERDIPIVFLSSHTEPEIVQKTEKITSYGYVVKNSSTTVLDASIKMAFKLFEAKVSQQVWKENVSRREQYLSTILKTTADGFWVVGLVGNFTEVNDAYLKMSGYTREEFLHLNITDVDESLNPREAQAQIASIMQTGSAGFETVHRRKDGSRFYVELSLTFLDVDGGRLICFCHDISKRKRAEMEMQTKNGEYEALNGELRSRVEELRETSGKLRILLDEKIKTESMLQAIIEQNPHSIQLLGTDGRTLRVNSAFIKLFGNVPPKDYSVFEDPLVITQGMGGLLKDLQDGHVVNFPVFYHNPHEIYPDEKDMPVWIWMVGFPILGSDGLPERYVIMHTDVSERKKLEDELKVNLEKFRQLFDAVSDSVFLIEDETGSIREVNLAAVATYGYSHEELLTMRNIDVSAEPERTKAAGQGQDSYIPVRWHKKKDGTRFPVEIAANRFLWNGKHVHMAAIRDISERIRAEDKIKSLLAEKELMLKEVHHRVKNNLNTIRALLSLQSGTVSDSFAISALTEASNRVQSMALLYDDLYRTAEYSEISVSEYLPSLIDEIVRNFPNYASITTVKNIDDFILDVKRLQPLGIIINELLTNTMKHAFTGRSQGKITVTVSLMDNIITVSVVDDGIGISGVRKSGSTTGFGLELVDALAKQLQATIRTEECDGTGTVLQFSKVADS